MVIEYGNWLVLSVFQPNRAHVGLFALYTCLAYLFPRVLDSYLVLRFNHELITAAEYAENAVFVVIFRRVLGNLLLSISFGICFLGFRR